jgi:hypothetical protein
MEAALSIAMRWLHIASAVVLLGGVFYARVAIGEMAQAFKPWVYVAIGGILASGIYNFWSKIPVSTNYKLWFSIKMLLALHVFASAILYRGQAHSESVVRAKGEAHSESVVRVKNKKRSLTGMVIAGALILAISGYLRWISQAI